MTSVSDWTIFSGAAFSKSRFLTFFIFHIMVYAFNFVSHVQTPHPFIFIFISLLFLNFLILFIFLKFFIHGRLTKEERSLAPPQSPVRGECITRCVGSLSCPGTSGAP